MTGRPRFHHMGVTVSNIEKSYAFYHRVAGFTFWNQEEELGTAPSQGRTDEKSDDVDVTFHSVRSASFDELTVNPGSEIKYVNLTSGDGFVLQLIQYTAKGGSVLSLDHNNVGSPHLSLFVDDVAGAFKQCQDLGFEPVSRVIDITPNMRSFYVRDPDGLPIELLEVHGT